jgi:hypothetical protein
MDGGYDEMTSSLEDIKQIDLEEWLTLNTASSPTKLKTGQSPNMQNVWVDEKPGSVITAPGYNKVGTTPSNNPSSFCVNFFRTSAGTQTFVVSDNATVWTTVDFKTYTTIITGLSGSFQLRGKVIRDKLWLTNGTDSVRVYDGSTTTVLDGNNGNPNVPKGRYIDYHDERVWLYHIPSNRSQCAFSALTDTSGTIIAPDNANAWPSSNTLQVSEGDADFGTGLLLSRGYLHFFQQYSIWRLVGYDEYTYTRVKTRSSTGTRFNESVQVLDSFVHFIGIDGIYVFDGEDSQRISDFIDPDSASQTAFGFNQLQQPNTNNQFFQVQKTSDWNLGTVSPNLVVSDQLSLGPADDSQADFNAGTPTNMDSSSFPGSIQLSRGATGGAGGGVVTSRESLYQNGGIADCYFQDYGNGAVIYGAGLNPAFQLISGVKSAFVGMGVKNQASHRIIVTLSSRRNIGRIIVRGAQGDVLSLNSLSIQVNTGTAETHNTANGTWLTMGTNGMSGAWTPYDATYDFAVTTAIQVAILFSAKGSFQFQAIEVYNPVFLTTGKFVSKTLDLGATPTVIGVTTMGVFSADADTNGQPLTYFVQSSSDGISWDSEQPVLNGGTSTATPHRYVRWGANFTSDGSESPVIRSAYLMGQYISAIHDTGGGIFAWGAIESDPSRFGQTIYYYYRTATTSAGIAGTSWSNIEPGSVLSSSALNRYVQFKVEFYGTDTPAKLPIVPSVVINWVVGSVQPQTLQNVASAYWRNRYWLMAAGPGVTANNTVLIRGKKTFGSPWMLKDWSILSVTRFQDNLYGCSSLDGSIYQLDTGYSKSGAALDSFFQTGDFTFGGFTANLVEVLIEAERMGSYSLNFGISIDRGRTWTEYPMDISISTFDQSYTKRINLNNTGDRFRFRFRTNGIDTPMQVHRCIVFYKLESERGSIRGDY